MLPIVGFFFRENYLLWEFEFNILFLNILLVLIGIIPYSRFTRLNNILYIYIYVYI